MALTKIVVGEDLGVIVQKTKKAIKEDLLFAMQILWGWDFLDAPFHASMASFISNPNVARKGILAPRGGGKSVEERAKFARDFLISMDEGVVPHTLCASYNAQTAIKNVSEIHSLIAGVKSTGGVAQLFHNTWLKIKDLPTTIPSKGIIDWNKALHSDHPDPVFQAAGINSGITSMHFSKALIDDLIDEVGARSPTEIARSLDWLATLTNCLEHQILSPVDLIGTHYGPNDPYSALIDPNIQQGNEFSWFIHAGLLMDPETDELVSYWPSKFSVEQLLQMKKEMGEYFFNALIQQSPSQHGDAFFKESNLHYWEWDKTRKQTLRLDNGETIFAEDLNVFLVFDPAMGKEYSTSDSAIIVVGIDYKERWFVLDTWAKKVPVDVACRKVVELIEEWRPLISGVEDVLFQELLIPALKGLHPALGYGALQLSGVKPQNRSKVARIMSLQPYFSQGRIFFNKKQLKLIRQTLEFRPDLVNKKVQMDVLDTLAYINDVGFAPAYPSRGAGQLQASLDDRDLRAGRNKTTGY